MKNCLVLLALCLFTVSCKTTQQHHHTNIYLPNDPPATGWKKPPPKKTTTASSSTTTKKPSSSSTSSGRFRVDQAGNKFRDVPPEDMEPSEQILRVDR